MHAKADDSVVTIICVTDQPIPYRVPYVSRRKRDINVGRPVVAAAENVHLTFNIMNPKAVFVYKLFNYSAPTVPGVRKPEFRVAVGVRPNQDSFLLFHNLAQALNMENGGYVILKVGRNKYNIVSLSRAEPDFYRDCMT